MFRVESGAFITIVARVDPGTVALISLDAKKGSLHDMLFK